MRKLSPVYAYVLAVSALGVAVFAALLGTGELGHILSARSLLFADFVILGELLPITVPRQGEADEITTSTTFSLALLLTAGIPAAIVAQVIGSVLADGLRRKPWWKAGFNAAQYALSLSAAGGVLILFSGTGFSRAHFVSAGSLLPILAAGAVFFLVNTSLTATALALAQGVRIRGYLGPDLLFQLSTEGVLLLLAPVVVLVSETSLLLVALIAAPMVAVYKSTRVSLENASLVRRLEQSLADLSEMNRLNEHQALHDSLTALPNRTLFLDRVAQAVRSAHRDKHRLALLLIDLDRFKDINDTLGHHHGDLLLQLIGQRLAEALRESDTIARLGGDEFGVLVPHLTDQAAASQVADRIRQALVGPFEVEELKLDVEASIGIAMYPDHGRDAEALIQRADLAMYAAKAGHQGIEVYAARYDRRSRSRLSLLGELRRAIDEGQLVLHYQPKIELESGQVIGVEALLRWMHPTRQLIPPDEFIPFAEHTGIIRSLTLFVLDAALRQTHEWREAGQELAMAVNLSARNVVDPQLPKDVAKLLEKWDVPPDQLELEITESALMGEPLRAKWVLSELSAMGVAVSLDDFGTGYSSLASLKRLPVNEIKIDRSFVMNMAAAESDAVIVKSTIDLAHNLGLRVVAEGVETKETWDMLARLHCDVAQGYYLSRPVPAAEIPSWYGREPVGVRPVEQVAMGGGGLTAIASDLILRLDDR
jgi:diguanylate cyclase (GGDEF)-like protein